MAAEFFLERQFMNYAYVGHVQNANWSVRRQTTYMARLRQAGFTTAVVSSIGQTW